VLKMGIKDRHAIGNVPNTIKIRVWCNRNNTSETRSRYLQVISTITTHHACRYGQLRYKVTLRHDQHACIIVPQNNELLSVKLILIINTAKTLYGVDAKGLEANDDLND